MKKYTAKVKITIELPSTKGRIQKTDTYVYVTVDAENEYEAELLINDKIQFDYQVEMQQEL